MQGQDFCWTSGLEALVHWQLMLNGRKEAVGLLEKFSFLRPWTTKVKTH